jgi:hypothetical protein
MPFPLCIACIDLVGRCLPRLLLLCRTSLRVVRVDDKEPVVVCSFPLSGAVHVRELLCALGCGAQGSSVGIGMGVRGHG